MEERERSKERMGRPAATRRRRVVNGAFLLRSDELVRNSPAWHVILAIGGSSSEYEP